jgi:hypothetical protein
MIGPAKDTTIALPAKSSNFGLIAAMSRLKFERANLISLDSSEFYCMRQNEV